MDGHLRQLGMRVTQAITIAHLHTLLSLGYGPSSSFSQNRHRHHLIYMSLPFLVLFFGLQLLRHQKELVTSSTKVFWFTTGTKAKLQTKSTSGLYQYYTIATVKIMK